MGNWYYPHKRRLARIAKNQAIEERRQRRVYRRIKVWATAGTKKPFFLVEYQRFVTIHGKEWRYHCRSGFVLHKIRVFGVLPAARYLLDKTRTAVLCRMEEDQKNAA